MDPKPVIEILLGISPLIPLLYFFYLYFCRPWSDEKVRRKLHEFGGGRYVSTEDGGVGITEDGETNQYHFTIYRDSD